MPVETDLVSLAWQPDVPQVSGTTRKSPGFTNLMYSADSLSHFVKARSGNAPPLRNRGSRGCTWAFSFAPRYSGELRAAPGSTLAVASPPWQSVHPSSTVFVGCIVGSSIGEWQVLQPADLRSASARDWPRRGSEGSCHAAE